MFLTTFRRFPTTFRRFPKIFQNCFEGLTNVSEHFPNIFRRLPKVAEDFRGSTDDVSIIQHHLWVLFKRLCSYSNGNLTCWSLFDRSSNFSQSAHDLQTALGVHSFASVSRNEMYTCVWMVFYCVWYDVSFACWEFWDTPGRFVRHRIYYKSNVLFLLI